MTDVAGDRAMGEQRRKMRKGSFTLRQMAARMKITPSYLSDLERGNRHWNERVTKLFDAALKPPEWQRRRHE